LQNHFNENRNIVQIVNANYGLGINIGEWIKRIGDHQSLITSTVQKPEKEALTGKIFGFIFDYTTLVPRIEVYMDDEFVTEIIWNSYGVEAKDIYYPTVSICRLKKVTILPW
jgi:hypothetical protein